MGLNVMKAGVHILKALIFFIKACYRVVRYHPSILGVVLLFFLIYRFVPSVFNYLLSSFPICVCTIVLIATLVAFGRRQDSSQVDEKRKSSQKTKLIKDDSIIEKDQKTCEEPDLKKTVDIKEKAIEGVNLTQGSKRKGTKRVTFSPITHDGSIGRTVISHQPKEIHEDGKQASDKPVGETPDAHLKDPSCSSNDASLKQNEVTAESSGTGSIRAESSSPEASMVDINPVTDGPHQVSMDEIDGAPEESDRSNDDGFDSEEAEKNGTKAAVTWTEDDEKNLMDLGSSEVERNQRLESLMARRRARKKLLRMEAEKNLIDLDNNDLPVQMAPLSIIKNNPFVPISDNEIPGLPPLPGSAPSVLVPRTNPFDLPYDPQEEKPVLTGDSFHQEFMTVLQKDIYCRHESFCFGSTSYLGGLKDKGDNNIRTYSIIEDLASTEQRPLSERSDSTSSFVPETELRSSIPDQEDQKKAIEEQLTQEGETFQIDHSAHSVDRITQSSEADLVEIHQENPRDVEISLPDVVEEKYSGLSSSSSSSSSEFNENDEFESQNVEPARGDFTEGPSLISKDSDLKSGITVKLKDNNQPHEPFYDSSPSATEKRTIDESLFCVDKGVVLTSVSSIASDMQVEVSEVNSPSASSERITAFTDEESLRYDENLANEDLWAASSNLSAVDENESKSMEVTEISESDVIKFGGSGASRDSVDAISAVSPVLQPLVDSNTTALINEPIIEGSVTQNPSSSAEPEMHEQVHHQVELEENVEPVASCSSTGQLLAEKSYAQPPHLKETQEPSTRSSEEVQIINNVEDPVAIDSDSTFSPSLNEPINEDLISPITSSTGEPEVQNRDHQLNSEEKADQIASSSLPVQTLDEKSTVQPSVYGDHHEESQEPYLKSTEDSNIINNVKDPVAVYSNSTSSQMNDPIKEGSINEIPFSNTEPERHNLVHQMNLKENADMIDISSSPVQVLVEKSDVLPSKDVDHHEEVLESIIKSTEEGNIINDLKDPEVVDYNSTSSQLMNKPREEGLINQIPSASAEPEMQNNVHQWNAEENVDPIASSSSPVQPLVEKSIVQPSMYDDHHEKAQEPSMESTEEGNIINNVKDPVAADSNSTSSLPMNEPTKAGLNNQIPSSGSKLEMHNQVHQLNLKENMNPIASGSSHVKLLIEKSMVRPSKGGDPYDEAQEQPIKSTELHNISNNVNDPAEINTNSTSSAMDEPIKEGLIKLSNAEPDKHNSIDQLNLEENVNSIASSSSPVQFMAEKLTVPPSVDVDHHEEALEPSTNSTEKDNIVDNEKDPGTVDSNSTSSLMNQPITEGLMNQNPSPSAEQEMQNRAQKLNLEENVDPIAFSSSPVQVLAEMSTVPAMDGDHHEDAQEPSSTEKGNIINNVKDPGAVDSDSTLFLINEPVKDGLMNQNATSGAVPEMHNRVHQSYIGENADSVVSSSTSSLMNGPIEEGSMHHNPSSSAEPKMHNQVHQMNLGENVDPIVSNSTSSLMNESMEEGLMNQNPSSGAEPEMHNRVHQLNLGENEDPIISNSTSSLMNEPMEQGLINQNPSLSAEPEMHNQGHHSNLKENVDPIASSSSPELLVEKSTVPPSMDVDPHEETQVEPSINSTDEGNTLNNLKNSLLVVDEEKPKSIEDVEEDSKRSIERLVIVANLPETMSESGDYSFPDQHGSYKLQEATENKVQKQVLEANHHLETEITPKDLHTEQEVQPIKPETIIESGTGSSADHHPDHGISSKLPETTEVSEIQKQAFEETTHLETGTSKHLPIEQEVVHQLKPDETILEAGVVSSAVHPDDHGSYRLPETMESGIQNKEASEANYHPENGSISEHLQEKEFHQQVTPETTLESSRVVNSIESPDDHGSNNLQQKMENGTQKQLDFEANHDLENETSKHLLHNEQEVHQQVTPETLILESGSTLSSTNHPDHDTIGSYLQTNANEIQKESLEAANRLENEITSKHLHNEQEVVHQLTPETISESAGHPDHENHNLQQTMELSGTAFAQNHIEDEVNPKHLHSEQEVVQHQQATPETILESASVTPTEHPEHENHNLQQSLEVSGTTQKQAVEENHLEGEVDSKHMHNEQEVVHHQQATPETVLESASVTPAEHPEHPEHENHNLQQTLEVSGTTQKLAIEENHLEDKVDSKHLPHEQEVVRHQLTSPETILEPADLNSLDQADDHGTFNQRPTAERETSPKEAASEANDQHLEKEKTTKHNQLHEQEELPKLTDYIC